MAMKTIQLISLMVSFGTGVQGAGHKYKKGDRVELWMNKVNNIIICI